MATTLCPCHSGANYSDCCQPLHEGDLPKNALQLMRSRFSAYALGRATYIIATTHPDSPLYEKDLIAWKHGIESFSNTTSFRGLTILSFEDGREEATVTFTAQLFQGPRNTSFTEKSLFKVVAGRWLYHSATSMKKA